MSSTNLLQALSDNIEIDKNKCTFCNVCVETCILDNLRMKLAPCSQGCPMKVNVQGYVQEIARGKTERALDIVSEKTPFYKILGRICHHPCESGCHRKKMTGEAVSIRSLKRHLADHMDAGGRTIEPKAATGKQVAIVGSGPAGMQAAFDLSVNGHQVTVFESESSPGGMLRWAIPEFRLPVNILEEELNRLRGLNVEFKCDTRIGIDIELAQLEQDFDAVLVATGCPRPSRLKIFADEKNDVVAALDFLKQVRAGKAPEIKGVVTVVGGGNAAVDAAMTALRMGADHVNLVSLESPDDLPAFAEAIEDARNEGIEFLCGWGPKHLDRKDGRLIGIELERCLSVFDQNGCFNPSFDSCELKVLASDFIIEAIGQTKDLSCLQGREDLFDQETLKADRLTRQSPAAKVFFAGDFLRGPSSVVDAMADGKEAAVSIDRLLGGEPLAYGRNYRGPFETEFEIDTATGSGDRRVSQGRHRAAGKGDFTELEKALEPADALREAARCYSCGQPFGKFRTCWFCLPCEVECPNDALWVEIPYLLR